jgi:protein-tyrosine phosphatase
MKKILFVCLGNICRSPAAEGVFKEYIISKKLQQYFSVDSCGTSAFHQGQRADKRIRAAASKRGIELTSLSRAFQKVDFLEFDLIIAMDDSNYENLMTEAIDDQQRNCVVKFCDYLEVLQYTEVPDPYYGGEQGFETVLDILQDGSKNLLKEIQK